MAYTSVDFVPYDGGRCLSVYHHVIDSTMLATSSMSIFLYDFQCFLDFNRVAASKVVTSS
jgi:hypothetical protein